MRARKVPPGRVGFGAGLAQLLFQLGQAVGGGGVGKGQRPLKWRNWNRA
ncbi:MAG: hypothetical protein WKG07_06430 [Hymenobacter sp.]